MEWQEMRREEVIGGIKKYYCEKIAKEPQKALMLIDQELHSEFVRLGNDWTGRGVVMDTIINATIEGLEIVRSYCLEELQSEKHE